MRRIETLALLVALVLAGCASPLEDESTQDTLGGQESPYSPFDHNVRIVDCIGFGALREFTNYNAPIDGPSEWPVNDDTDLSSVEFDLYECQKVEWGPFSRGPLTFIIESHSNFDIPPACQQIRGSGLMILSIGFSDPDLVEYFRDRFGMPTYLANITIDEQETQGIEQWTWQWGPMEPQSHLAIMADFGEMYDGGDLRDGFFWANGSAVNGLEIIYEDTEVPLIQGGQSHGRLEPPMALAEHDENDWIGRTGIRHVPEIIGQVTEFDDWDCTPKGGSNGNQTT